MRHFLRDNGLTLALSAMFFASLAGMALSGHSARNQELTEHGQAAIGLVTYLSGGVFLSALFENWESEFLQMAAYVILTAMLFQRGSAESRDPVTPTAWETKYRGAIVSQSSHGSMNDHSASPWRSFS